MPSETFDPDSPVAIAAANWLTRRERGFTPAEQDGYLQWLREDPRHAATVARIELAWEEMNLLSEWRPAHGAQPNPDLLAPPAPRRLVPLRWWAPVVLAAAAAWLLLLWLGRPVLPTTPSGATMAAVVDHYDTAVGESRQVTLADGSVIALNTNTAVEVALDADTRRVTLRRGEALFTVAKDNARPFMVTAAGATVRAVGTVFDVELRLESVAVLVAEGRVDVAPAEAAASEHALVAAGRQVVLATRAAAAGAAPPTGRVAIDLLPATEISRRLAWRDGRLEFLDAPLSEIVAAFNRYNARPVEIGDPELADLRLGGTFRTDGVDALLQVLEARFGVRVTVDSDAADAARILRRASQSR